jgi:hypothetical protein
MITHVIGFVKGFFSGGRGVAEGAAWKAALHGLPLVAKLYFATGLVSKLSFECGGLRSATS